jgi:hypothetical protein
MDTTTVLDIASCLSRFVKESIFVNRCEGGNISTKMNLLERASLHCWSDRVHPFISYTWWWQKLQSPKSYVWNGDVKWRTMSEVIVTFINQFSFKIPLVLLYTNILPSFLLLLWPPIHLMAMGHMPSSQWGFASRILAKQNYKLNNQLNQCLPNDISRIPRVPRSESKCSARKFNYREIV